MGGGERGLLSVWTFYADKGESLCAYCLGGFEGGSGVFPLPSNGIEKRSINIKPDIRL